MANSLVSKVEITVSCRKLMDKDILSKSDPIVALFIKHGTDKFQEFGRTEMILNNLNPDFSKSFFLDYYFEEVQKLLFKVYDVDSDSSYLDDHDFLGEFSCNLGELVSRSSIEAHLKGRGITQGTIILRCAEVGSCKEVFRFNFSASGLPKKGWLFGSCDPFLEIYRTSQPMQFIAGEPIRIQNSIQFVLAHRTEHVHNSQNPHWRTFEIRNWRLCQGDRDWLLRIDCLHKVPSGKNSLIGSFFTSINDLSNNESRNNYFHLMKPDKMNERIKGYVTLVKFEVDTEYTFVDYISGGTQLHFTVSVDFTASNGNQSKANSLHYIHTQIGRLNQYETAICAVGSIIQDYDYDKRFPGLGFGAKLPPSHQVSHCFPMNLRGRLDDAYCYRVEGLLENYRQAVRKVTLFGPTNFAPSIRHVQKIASKVLDGSHYYVLLIITDGIITDMDNTIQALVDSSSLPMSVIIVGVGEEDFSAMDALDCDNGLLRYGKKVAERDIVQFVPLRDYINLNQSSVSQHECLSNQSKLARSVLAELPDQVSLWMRQHRIKPSTPSHEPINFDRDESLSVDFNGGADFDFGVPTAPSQPISPVPYPLPLVGSTTPLSSLGSSPQPPYTPMPPQLPSVIMYPIPTGDGYQGYRTSEDSYYREAYRSAGDCFPGHNSPSDGYQIRQSPGDSVPGHNSPSDRYPIRHNRAARYSLPYPPPQSRDSNRQRPSRSSMDHSHLHDQYDPSPPQSRDSNRQRPSRASMDQSHLHDQYDPPPPYRA